MPALVAGFTIAIVFGAVLSIVLTAAGPDGMGLSDSVIAGAVLPFVVDIFSSLSTADGRIPVEVPIMVGSTVLAYLVGQLLLGKRFPAILPSFLVGLLVAGLTGQIGGIPALFALPGLEFVAPAFSWSAIATVMPVLLALMTVQSNVPSVIYLRSQGYDPPECLLNVLPRDF